MISQLTTDLNNVQGLVDEPNDVGGLTPALLKAVYDKAGNDIKDYLNDILTVEIDNIDTVGNGNLTTHKTSNDHDGRYYTETEINTLLNAKTNLTGNHEGTWQGFTPTLADPGISSVVAGHTSQLADNTKKVSNVVNVKGYGAVGDGITDDKLAVSLALADIVSAGGGTLYFPSGTFYLTTPITISNINIKIAGAGIGITKLLFASNVNGIIYTSNDTSSVVEIRDMTMLTNGLGGADAVTITMPSHPADAGFGLLIENIYISGEDSYGNGKFIFNKYWRIGVKCTEAWYTIINNLHFLGSQVVGQSQTGIQFNAKSIDTRLNDVSVFGAQRAIEYLGQCEGVNIDKAVIVNCLMGIYMDGDSSSANPPGTGITNSHISTFDGWIYLKGRSQLNISNLLCYRAGGSLENANFVGIYLAQGASVSTDIINIHHCNLLNLGTKALEFAVRMHNTNYCSVKDNFISGFGTGVKLEANASLTHVKNNQFIGCINEVINLGISSNLGSEPNLSPTLLNTWVNFGVPFQNIGYYKDSSGIVHLQGTIKSGSTDIFVLPVGYRPAGTIAIEIGSTVRIDVTSDGYVRLISGANTFLNLNLISFKPNV